MYGSSCDKSRFMKNFRFDTICNILGNHKNYRDTIVPLNSSATYGKSAVMKYNQLYC